MGGPKQMVLRQLTGNFVPTVQHKQLHLWPNVGTASAKSLQQTVNGTSQLGHRCNVSMPMGNHDGLAVKTSLPFT